MKRIKIDRDVCVGAGMCVVTAPHVFDQDETDGRVVLVTDDYDESMVPLVEEAVAVCPSGALSIISSDD